ALVGTMRRSGLPVELATRGERDTVPAAIDLAGFRIVQESLTNVLRHAGPAHAQVTVCYGPGAIEIEVTDDGSARPDTVPRPGGHGIAGMRERSAAVGCTLDAEPREGGGFRVRAHLPLSGAGA
ncbi:MAG: sensor histidine kinase, partial [Candidatus Dormibacteraceae bacterium]